MKKVNRKKHNYKIPIAIIVVTLIIDFSVILFMKTKKIDDPEDYIYIAKYADLLNEKVKVVNDYHDNFYQKQKSNLYIDTLNESVSGYEELITNYTEALDEVVSTYKRVEKQCSHLYADSDTNDLCDTMKINYETANNFYVNDINKYNSYITAYNNNSDNVKLNTITLKYGYVDANQDKIYIGNEGE